MPNYGYHLARTQGNVVRTVYRALLPSIASRRIPGGPLAAFNVFAYSGESTYPLIGGTHGMTFEEMIEGAVE